MLLLAANPALAQVVSPAGTTDVMIGVQYAHIYAHTARNAVGSIQRNIDLRSVSVTIGAEHSVTDRLALGISVPYITSRYRGASPHPGVVVDDGGMHGAMQDLQLDARYALVRGDFLLSPFAVFRHPVSNYETMGHASPGRGLNELEAGFSAGHLVAALPRAFVGANVSYTVSEAVEGMRVNRSQADLQLGYAVTDRLFIRGFGAWQRSHGGLDVPVPQSSEWFHHHDQLARSNYTRAGAGMVISMTESINVHLAYATVFASSNSHMGRSLTFATSWSFAPRRGRGQHAQVAAASSYRTPSQNSF
jgi:hypothetical protein